MKIGNSKYQLNHIYNEELELPKKAVKSIPFVQYQETLFLIIYKGVE